MRIENKHKQNKKQLHKYRVTSLLTLYQTIPGFYDPEIEDF